VTVDTDPIVDSGQAAPATADDPTLVHQLLCSTAVRDPSAIAVHDVDGACTYASLLRQAGQFAQWLLDYGIRPGDRIAVDAVPDRRFAAMLYGCLAVGAVFVPLASQLTAPERAHLLRDSAPALVVSHSQSPVFERTTVSVLEIWGRLPASPRPIRSSDVAASDAALLIYTSGSSSRPKGVLCRHAQVAYSVAAIGSRLGYRSDDIVFTRLPVSFDYGLYQLFLCAAAGAAIAFTSDESDARLLTKIAAVSATVVPVVPALAEMLTALAKRTTAVRTVRLFTNTGERLGPRQIDALRKHFPKAEVQLMYGLTECKRVSIGEPDGDLDRPGTVGRALPGTRVIAVDPSGSALPPFATGELVVSGPHVMDGYWRAPELTRQKFRARRPGEPRSLHTGDWGHLDADGYIYLEGRRDDQYKSRGVRTSAMEIEEAANAVPGVRRAVVLPPKGGDEAVLCVIANLSPDAVLRGLRETLEPAKIPPSCQVFESLPLSPNGKVDRAVLARWARS
jgi:acyl-CoA synthetase (AMP-forming)/AMP-acid ligase II